MEQKPSPNTADLATETKPMELDPVKFQAWQRQVESEQNLSLAVMGGAVAALIGAALWAAITVFTQFQIGWMAIGVGFLVGFAVRWLGKGIGLSFGIAGAVLSLLGCLLGNLMSACGFVALEKSVPFFRVLQPVLQNPALAFDLLKAAFHPMDILFYAIAVYEGYKLSFRRLTAEEASKLAKPQ
jgi:hypothetical protein